MTEKQALRYNSGKPQMSMIALDQLKGMARVCEYGAQKYSRGNYRRGAPAEQHLDCLLRHSLPIIQYLDSLPEDRDPTLLFDPESWLPHVCHLQWNALTLGMSLVKDHGIPEDPRFNPNPPKKGESANIDTFLDYMCQMFGEEAVARSFAQRLRK